MLRLNTTSGVVEVLSSRVTDDGSPIFYCNGLDVAANGSVLFTASTDILPARSMDGGSYDTGGAWALNLFRGIARCVHACVCVGGDVRPWPLASAACQHKPDTYCC